MAWLIAASFSPWVIAWKTGQVAPIMLLGVVGFLAFLRAERPVLAGASLALVAVKPQLAYLMWPALMLLLTCSRDIRVALSLGLTLGLLLVAALATNSDVLRQFVELNRNEPPHLPQLPYVLPSASGSALRWLAVRFTEVDVPVLQFVPVLAGVLWLLWYGLRRDGYWDWIEHMPLLLLVSFATTPWCWVYDEVLLLVPLIQVSVWLTSQRCERSGRWLLAAYLLVNLAILAADVARAPATSYVWTQYTLLALYLIATAVARPLPDLVSVESPFRSHRAPDEHACLR